MQVVIILSLYISTYINILIHPKIGVKIGVKGGGYTNDIPHPGGSFLCTRKSEKSHGNPGNSITHFNPPHPGGAWEKGSRARGDP